MVAIKCYILEARTQVSTLSGRYDAQWVVARLVARKNGDAIRYSKYSGVAKMTRALEIIGTRMHKCV